MAGPAPFASPSAIPSSQDSSLLQNPLHGPSSPSKIKPFASIFAEKSSVHPAPLTLITLSTHHGEPARIIPQDLVEKCPNLSYTLIEKFSHGRSTLEESRLIFLQFNLKGSFISAIWTANTCIHLEFKVISITYG